MDEDDWRPLKIDHAALLRGRVLELHQALEAVWGDSNVAMSLGRIEGGLVRWFVERYDNEPVRSARNVMVESAAMGMIVKSGNQWKRARYVSSRASRRGGGRQS